MKTIIKCIAAVLLAVLLCFAAACSAQGTGDSQSTDQNAGASLQPGDNLDPSNPVTITLWHYYTGANQQALEDAIAEFNQTVGRDSGVIVEAVALGSIAELEEAVTDSAKGVINSEPMPEIFSCYADKAIELNELNALCNLNEYFTEQEQSAYVEGFLNDGILDGELLVLPVVKSMELLYVNQTALDEFAAENPNAITDDTLKTWESIYNLSKAYYEWTDAKTPDTPWDGKGFMGIDELANYLIVSNKQMGIDIMDAQTALVVLNKDALKKIFDLYYSGMSLGYFDAVGKFRSDDVKTGDLVGYVGSSSSASYFPTFTEVDNHTEDITLLAAEYPIFEGGESYAIQQGAGMAVAQSDSAKEEGAVLFLKWFTQPEQNIGFAMSTGYLPVERAAYYDPAFDEELDALREGDAGQQNVDAVYTIALEEITDGNPYAAKSFDGSYDVRSMLKASLSDAAAAGKEQAQALKAQGMTGEEILAELDVDAQFNAWLETVQSELDNMGVGYTVE